MKFTVAAVAALAAGAQASYAVSNETVVYTTEVVDVYTTYCPAATEITHNGQTYTVTEATTLTISDCPCTISKPVYTTSAVVCSTCAVVTSSAPAVKSTGYTNGTVAVTTAKGTGSTPTTTAKGSSGTAATSVPTAGAGKVAALSGAALAGLLGVAALL